jgi:hypothetical protein
MFYFTDGLGALPGVMHAFGDVSNSGKPTNLFIVPRNMVHKSLRLVIKRRLASSLRMQYLHVPHVQ